MNQLYVFVVHVDTKSCIILVCQTTCSAVAFEIIVCFYCSCRYYVSRSVVALSVYKGSCAKSDVTS